MTNQALVILLRSISGKWKQPLGYALVNDGCPREEMEELMKNAIDKIEAHSFLLTFLLLFCLIWEATSIPSSTLGGYSRKAMVHTQQEVFPHVRPTASDEVYIQVWQLHC